MQFGRHVQVLLLALFVSAAAKEGEGQQVLFRGKTIRVIVGTDAGGAYDVVTRVVVANWARHIPGNPNLTVSYITGGSGLALADYMENTAPRDGSTIGVGTSNFAFEPRLHAMSQASSNARAAFDAQNFGWIGSPSRAPHVLWFWSGSGIRSIDDLKSKPVLVGSTSAAGTSSTMPRLLDQTIGAKLRVVSGYPGQGDIFTAAERGEVAGSSAELSDITSTRPDWLKQGKIKILVQFGAERMPELPDVPTAWQLAQNPLDRDALKFIGTRFDLAFPFFLPPDVPINILNTLRTSFDETMKDPAFIEQAKGISIRVDPYSGEQIAQFIDGVEKAPPNMINRVATLIAVPK